MTLNVRQVNDNLNLCRRFHVRLKSPNPLFEKWLEEWRVEADLRHCHSERTFRKALSSLRKFPLALKNGKQCMILEHFTTKICKKLDDKLCLYRKLYPVGIGHRSEPPKIIIKLKNQNGTKELFENEMNREDNTARIILDLDTGKTQTFRTMRLSNAERLLNYDEETKATDCQKYLATLTELCMREPKAIERSVMDSIQELIDGKLEPKEFCNVIDKVLNFSSRSSAPDFLKESLPYLRIALISGDLDIEGIRPPPTSEQPCKTTGSAVFGQQCLNYMEKDENQLPFHIDDDYGPSKPGCKKPTYIPAKGTGAYALLITLHDHLCRFGAEAGMTKKELKQEAQFLCDVPFDECQPGSRYTAWSAMGQLCRKMLAWKSKNPARYHLTALGTELAEKLKNATAETNSMSDLMNISVHSSSVNVNDKFLLDIDEPSTSKETAVVPFTENKLRTRKTKRPRKINNSLMQSYNGRQAQTFSSSDEDDINIGQVHTFSSSDEDNINLQDRINLLKKLSTNSIFSKSVNNDIAKKARSKPSCTIVRPPSEEPAACLNKTNIEDNEVALRLKNNDEKFIITGNMEILEPVLFLTRKPDYNNINDRSSGVVNEKNLPISRLDTCQALSDTDSDNKKNFVSTSSQTNLPENIKMLPDQYEPILLIDTAEMIGKSSGVEAIKSKLSSLDINCEIRHLNVGDYAWICRDLAGNEFILPYIIERKRLDDFAKSIKDGRFHEQKFRLKSVPVKQRIYIVEGFGRGSYGGLPLSTLMQAASNTQLIDGFMVKFTKDYHHTFNYLSALTRKFTQLLVDKTLIGCGSGELPPFNWDENVLQLITFNDFMKNANKKRKFTVREMFVRHLLQMHGLSVEKAKAVVSKYPCPRSLLEAYRNGSGDENLFTKVKVGKLERCLGAVISKNIYNLYSKDEFA